MHHDCGRIVRSESFIEDTKVKKAIVNEYSPTCVELESSSVGHVAFINNTPFIIIRCISDHADVEVTTT
ncbi:hypothetical protein [Peribacillus acanthi]|uniref:phosphorylase family protein n=1 Tax=Peribacillus acanthi TaxID=2171554 RepID=UPI0013005039|nr:hypothetical protein [Peribacillus acanthi]